MGRIIRADHKPMPWEGYRLEEGSLSSRASGLWLFNEGAGGVARDSVGGNHVLLSANALHVPDGIQGTSTPTSPFSNPVTLTTPFSLVAGMRYAGSFYQAIAGNAGDNNAFLVSDNDSQRVGLRYTPGGSVYWGAFSTKIESMAAAIATPTTLRFAFDGRMSDSQSVALASAGPFTHMFYQQTGNPFASLCRWFAIYPFALTADEIAYLHATPYADWVRDMPVFYSIPSTVSTIFRRLNSMRSGSRGPMGGF